MHTLTPGTLNTNRPGNSTHRQYYELLPFSENSVCVYSLSNEISVIQIQYAHIRNDNCAQVCEYFFKCFQLTDHVLVSLSVEEQSNPKLILNWYKELYCYLNGFKRTGKIKNFTIITNRSFTSSDNSVEDIIDNLDNVLAVHWFMCTYSVLYPTIIPRNTHSDNVLFLPGKLRYRAHRAGVLYNILTNHRYNSKCVYAYTADQHSWQNESSDVNYWQEIYKAIHNYDTECTLSCEEIKKLFKHNQRDLDGVQTTSQELGAPIMYPVSAELYNMCSVELVAETSWPSGHKHLTEKTFRAILAGQVFVHLNSIQTAQLHKLGFRTFAGSVNNFYGKGWQSIHADDYCHDSELRYLDLKDNLHTAFDIASNISKGEHQSFNDIIDHNRSHCDTILNEYKTKLNESHDNLFDDHMIKQLYCVHGAY